MSYSQKWGSCPRYRTIRVKICIHRKLEHWLEKLFAEWADAEQSKEI
jgi:hypothetical protein